jgi:hypothetical protein
MADETLGLIATVEKFRGPYVDGRVLATALKLVYFTGMRRKEIISLTIGDVLNAKKQIVDEIKSCEKTIDNKTFKLLLPNNVKAILREYLVYLKKNGYCIDPLAPVFPQKNGAKYGFKKLREHFNKNDMRVPFEQVRQAGLHRIYSEPQDSYDIDLRYKRVAEYAREQTKSIKKLFGYYRKTGTRYSQEDEDEDIIFPQYIRDTGRDDDD